jgi:hypothetical protein
MVTQEETKAAAVTVVEQATHLTALQILAVAVVALELVALEWL